MNNGKICVSVCAETADALVEQIRRAEDLADVIEIRFDCLGKDEIQKAILSLPKIEKYYLATFRPSEQGGKYVLTLGERLKFWESLLWKNRDKKFLIDNEFDFKIPLDFENTPTIISFHDFSGIPKNLSAQYDLITELFSKRPNSIIKIAVQTEDIINTVPVWKLLE